MLTSGTFVPDDQGDEISTAVYAASVAAESVIRGPRQDSRPVPSQGAASSSPLAAAVSPIGLDDEPPPLEDGRGRGNVQPETDSICEAALNKMRSKDFFCPGELRELPPDYGVTPNPHARYLPEDYSETLKRKDKSELQNEGAIWSTEFCHSSSLSIGDVQKQMPKPDKIKDLVKYKGPASKKTVLKQATTNAELQKAIENRDPDMVAAILRFGLMKRCVNVNAPLWPKRERMLHLAARNNDRDICIMLLEAKAELDCDEITEGKCPLHEGCKAGSYDVVELLLDKKAQLEDCNFTGLRPLHWAASAGRTDVVDLLLDRRAKIDAMSGDTREPIHHAASGGFAETVRLLCKRGAKVDTETSNFERPIHFACQGGHVKVVAVLLDFGALGVMDGFGPKGTLTKFVGTPLEELVRAIEQLRFDRDEAEEMHDMGQDEEGEIAFRKVIAGYMEFGLVNSAASVHADAARCGFQLEPLKL